MPINYTAPFEVRDNRNGSWYWVHTHVLRDLRLSPAEKIIYSTLASYSNREQTAFPSMHKMSVDSGITERHVYRCIKKLESLSYVSVERHGNKGGANIYRLNKTTPDIMSEVGDDMMSPLTYSHPSPDIMSSPPDKSAVPPPDKSAGRTRSILTRTNEQEPFNKKEGIPLIEQMDVEKISEDYKVPISFVTSKYDDLINYCKSKGKTYRDYEAALRNWVKKDAMSIRKEEDGRSKLRIITPDPTWANPN